MLILLETFTNGVKFVLVENPKFSGIETLLLFGSTKKVSRRLNLVFDFWISKMILRGYCFWYFTLLNNEWEKLVYHGWNPIYTEKLAVRHFQYNGFYISRIFTHSFSRYLPCVMTWHFVFPCLDGLTEFGLVGLVALEFCDQQVCLLGSISP